MDNSPEKYNKTARKLESEILTLLEIQFNLLLEGWGLNFEKN